MLDPSTGKLVAADDDAPRPALVLIDPATRAIVASETAPAHRIRAIGGVYADTLLLSWEDTSCGFARFRPGAPIEWVTTDVCPKHIAVGKTDVLAHALVGESHAVRQLVRIDVEHGRIELLTKGTLDVQSPIPAAAHPATPTNACCRASTASCSTSRCASTRARAGRQEIFEPPRRHRRQTAINRSSHPRLLAGAPPAP